MKVEISQRVPYRLSPDNVCVDLLIDHVKDYL